MSFWIYKKEKDGRTSVTSVTVPIEMLIIIFGMISVFLMPRYLHHSGQFAKDMLSVAAFGFFLFCVSKISLFYRGIWNSLGPKHMKKPFKFLYKSGYLFMAVGFIGGVLLYLLDVA